MAKLEVNITELLNYGTFMEDKAKEFATLKTKMQSTVEALSAWQGTDADTFKNSAATYFENLNSVEAAISQIGSQVKGISGNYAAKIQAFYDALG